MRCIYHGWKIDASGRVVECPTQTVRAEQFAASVPVGHFPVHEAGGLAWVWLGPGRGARLPRPPVRRRGPLPLLGHRPRCRATGSRASRARSTRCTPGCCIRPGSPCRSPWPSTPTSAIALAEPPDLRDRVTSYGLRAAALRKTADRSDVRAHHRAPDAARDHHPGRRHDAADGRRVRHLAGGRHPSPPLLRDRRADPPQRRVPRPDRHAGPRSTCPIPSTTPGCGATARTAGVRTAR